MYGFLFFFRNRWVIVVEAFRIYIFTKYMLAILPLPFSLQTFFAIFLMHWTHLLQKKKSLG